jgi:LPS-assembly protein
MQRFLFFLFFLFFLLSFIVDSGFAISYANLELTAKKLEFYFGTRTVLAEGNVVIKLPQTLILADSVEYHIPTQYLWIKNFEIYDNKNSIFLKGETAFLDLRNGEIKADKIFLAFKKQGIKIRAKVFLKNALNEYFAKEALITSCDLSCEDDKSFPPWSIVVKNFVLTSKGITTGSATEFKIKNIPIVYVPQIVFFPKMKIPLLVSRKSGLLTPKLVHSNLLGWGIQLPLFLVMNDQIDYTIAPMYLSKRGMLWDVENRFKFEENFKGIIKIRYLKDQQKEGGILAREPSHKEKWWTVGKIDFLITPHTDFHLDFDLVSQKNFLEEFDVGVGSFSTTKKLFLKEFKRDIEDKSQDYRTSKMWLQSFKNSFYFKIENKYLDSHGSLNKTEVLQPFGNLYFGVLPFNLFSPHLLTSFSFNYLYTYREKGYYGHEGTARLTVSSPFALWFLKNNINFKYYYTFYYLQDKTSFSKNYLYRKFYELKTDSYLEFYRYFSSSKSYLLHTVRPYVSYFYRKKPEPEEFPCFSYYDFITKRRKLLEYGIWQFFSTKYIKNFLSLKLYQQYDFTKTEKSPLTVPQEEKPFSDLYFQLNLNYPSKIFLRYDTTYNFYGFGFKKHLLNMEIKNLFSGFFKTLGISYQEDKAWNTRQISFKTTLHITRSFDTSFYITRNLITRENIETGGAISYQHKCYALNLSVTVTPEDTRFFFTFELKKLLRYGIGR